MNLNHLLYFQTLAHFEHYGRAAQELHIAQPSLTKAIQNMEQELHVKLFEKNGRGVRLTKQGAMYLNSVDNAMYELKVGKDLLRYEYLPPDSYLRLGMTLAVSYYLFPGYVKEFQKEHKDPLFYSCLSGANDELAIKLKQGKVDLIFCEYLQDPLIQREKIQEHPLTLLVPKGHPLYGRESVDIHELNGERFVTHGRGTSLHKTLTEIFFNKDVLVRIVSEADNDIALMGMVNAGLGLGSITYTPFFAGENVCTVPILGSDYQGGIYLGWLKDGSLPDPARKFMEYILAKSRGAMEEKKLKGRLLAP